MPAILITGANRGLGLEFARQYSGEAWQVFAACRNPSSANHLQELKKAPNHRLTILPIDVTDLASVVAAAKELAGTAIDLLVNNAGIAGPSNQTTGRVDYRAWAHVLDVNTMGPLRLIESFADHLARSDRRLVVTMTSGMGSLADNTSGGSIAYRTSKAAVNMVTRSAAIDLASRRITCIVVNPGWVKTDMGGPGARLTPEESVAALRRLIANLTLEDSGKFFNWDGREYPW
jgi:NAD(P)-dependent dehydrogenase (short-subunit alcohol dehydrogenase family)